MATVYADATYGYNSSDATINFYNAIHSERNSNNTLIFRDMGTPWIVSPCVRLFDVDNLDIIFEDGFVLQESTLMAQEGQRRLYSGISTLNSQYPNGTLGTHYTLNDAGKLLYWLRADNTSITAYGAHFEGTYPTLNVGIDPSPINRQFSYEFGHLLQIADCSNFTWKGGLITNWSGDGINCEGIRVGKTFLVEDVTVKWCKRLGVSHIKGEGDFIIRDSILEENGMGPNGEFGTNTRQGITIEPNNADETAHFEGSNLRFIKNADSGLGLQLSLPEAGLGQTQISVILNGAHFEENMQQEDHSDGGSISISGTDRFNDTKGGDAIYGNNPLGGSAVFSDIASWNEYESFLNTTHYGDNYSVTFDETVVYKAKTTDGPNSVGRGAAPIEWEGKSVQQANVAKNFNIGNFLLVHEFNEPLISFREQSTKLITELTSTVTGNLTVASPHTGGAITIDNQQTGGVVDNNTINKTQYALNALPSNVISIQATGVNAVKDTSTNGEFTFTRVGSTAFPMAVCYTVNTSGINSDMTNDFKLLRGSAVIPTGQASITVPVIPLNVDRLGGQRNITLTIEPKTDLYTVGTAQATVILSDTLINDTTAPAVTNTVISNITTTSFDVYWDLDEASKGQIEYGTSSGVYTNTTNLENTFLLAHLQKPGISSPTLTSGTVYYWRIRTEDAAGNIGYSAEQSTTTISIPTAGNVLTNSTFKKYGSVSVGKMYIGTTLI